MSLADPELDADLIEELYARGVTDGLPVVVPTRARVDRAVAASGRGHDELVALVPPNWGRATVEKVAVNAVMAGCRPEYLPVVLAAVEAVCDEVFDLHGVSATTNAPAPLVIVNGPLRATLDVNCGAGVFGSGWRANATIGRALRLVCVNVGGARPGEVSMSTLAPGSGAASSARSATCSRAATAARGFPSTCSGSSRIPRTTPRRSRNSGRPTTSRSWWPVGRRVGSRRSSPAGPSRRARRSCFGPFARRNREEAHE